MEEVNRLDHLIGLDVNNPVAPVALTGIICTIGESSRSPEVLENMMEAGMTVARIILGTDSYEYHAETIKNIREAKERYSERIGMPYVMGIAVDTRGPEIRIGSVDRSGAPSVNLKRGDSLKLTTEMEYLEKGNNKIVYINYENVTKCVSRGNRIYLNNGAISLICIGVASFYINCIIEIGGPLPRFADVRIPAVDMDLPIVTEQDKLDLAFATEQEVDIIFASFIRNIYGPVEIRNQLGRKGDKMALISKIENMQGVKSVKEILNVSDGIMIMRGLLGLEVSPEKIFLIQKSISSNCTLAGKPVICATQALEFMMKRNRPSRSEIADVANAIVDGMDCVLLTDETAIGEDPVSYITHMTVICKEAEAVIWQKGISLNVRSKIKRPTNIAVGVAISAVEAVDKCEAAAIIVLTYSGKSPKYISQYRPRCPVIVIARNPDLIPKILLYRSVIPLEFTEPPDEDWVTDVDIQLNYAVKFGVSQKIIKASDMIIAVTPWKQGFDFSSTVRYIYANDILELV